jgi:hypothetical protein
MKIYELPAEIRTRVYTLQIEAGNKPNHLLELKSKASEGNFDWHKSVEGVWFWNKINKTWYNFFYEKYPNKQEIITHDANFCAYIANQVLKNSPINLSEHSAEALEAHIIKVLAIYLWD